MALLRFSSDLDPVSNLLTLQAELERYLRNPAIRLGASGPGHLPPVNIFDDGDAIVAMAEIPGMDSASLNVSGQSHTLTIKGERKRETVGDAAGYHRRETTVR
jgi:HSP20 family protein